MIFSGRFGTASEIIIDEPADGGHVTVRLEGESLWLTQEQMAELFDPECSVMTKHPQNVFRERELEESSVCANFARTARDGKSYQTQHYNLDAIISAEDSPMANLMLSVMGAFAEFEHSLIKKRQREGIALAKQRGAYRGRKKSLCDTENCKVTAASRCGRKKPRLLVNLVSAVKRYSSICERQVNA